MFDDQLLQAFINGHYGYGDYHAKYWFVGMEERGGKSPKDISQRLNAWDKLGRNELDDVVEFHREIGINKHFVEPVVLQPTWNKIIRVLLSIEEHHPTTTAEVKAYQKNQLARKNGKSCLVELLPLPSPKANAWLHYDKYSRLPFLKTRPEYVGQVKPRRIEDLRCRIEQYKPEVVVFYGIRYEEDYLQIAGVEFKVNSDGVKVGKNNDTVFVMTAHPIAHGVTNAYFNQIGQMIAATKR
jgi:hypothetical protein